jgi:hypothetical protein
MMVSVSVERAHQALWVFLWKISDPTGGLQITTTGLSDLL